MTDSEKEEMMASKRARYWITIERIEKEKSNAHREPLEKSQIDALVERLMQIPGGVTELDLRVVLRLYCREVGVKPIGAIYE